MCGSIAYWGTKAVFYSGMSYVIGANEALAGAAINSAISAITGDDKVAKIVGGAIVGGIAGVITKSMIGVPKATTHIKENVVMLANIAVIEKIAVIISNFFTFLPFCP